MQDFTKLIVWRKSHELVLAVHRATQSMPGRRNSGLASQLRRAAISVPANIAEGCGHIGSKELARFLQIAMASTSEVQYHLLLARDLGVLSSPTRDLLRQRTIEIRRMLATLIQRVRHPQTVQGGTAIQDERKTGRPDS